MTKIVFLTLQKFIMMWKIKVIMLIQIRLLNVIKKIDEHFKINITSYK